MKSIKVMADESGPVWLAGGGPVSAYELPISDTLAAELWEWAGIYDGDGFETLQAEQQFAERGEALAKRLAVELGDGYAVSYEHNGAVRQIS
ncbi:hypothetical protein LWC34_34595 [Kibdelosporangium philippinense]|uniref:Uncharacterized protein n=1 Tax=Kibdelosporangium philippinense TaxID=211113 RepID=A0ABS8ZKE5_9PSEU|nr:hypothetical protein [Kibdelosporangium philippinense]MCE7007914.1 hypothetical protein [Kibdelosporangium philippinense]